uniref:Ig-like domain-containing protein n=1 Tax=Meloidogyne incognita TaxID=6306 RepID=A0A914MI36_MELIC
MQKNKYLRKHFNQVPISQRVHEGKTVQLQCHPPEGDPKPEIYWHKNGQQLFLADPFGNGEKEKQQNNHQNLIQAGDGSLILSSTHLSDSGNYSCEARNPARRVFTEPAHVTVYVDGGWSPWTEWEGHCTTIDSSNSIDCPVLLSQ